MSEISVQTIDDRTYRVTVSETDGSTTHEVTVDPADLSRIGGTADAPDLVSASFRFLLDREPKESILSRFNLSVIARYFPEYESRIGDYL
jgi:hypothetical protein